MFYISLIFSVIIVIWFVLIPALKLFGIGKTMNKKQVAQNIRKYLPEIDDKLINSIELAEDFNNDYSNELILASMEGGESLVQRLMKFTKGTWAGFINQPTNVDINKK